MQGEYIQAFFDFRQAEEIQFRGRRGAWNGRKISRRRYHALMQGVFARYFAALQRLVRIRRKRRLQAAGGKFERHVDVL